MWVGARGALAALGLCACTRAADPHPQLIISVDTDLPISSQVTSTSELSADAAIDTLRVDLLASDGSLLDSQLFIVPDLASWPVSFGVLPTSAPAVRLRIRAFRSQLAQSERALGKGSLQPGPEVAVDRILDLPFPADGIQRAGITLSGDCRNRPPSFGTDPMTCVDGELSSAPPTAGVTEFGEPTSAGAWLAGRDQPCSGAPPGDAVCIPGTFRFIGDQQLVGIDDGLALMDSAPLRPVIVRPFFIDRTEFSVGRLRALVQSGVYTGALPRTVGMPPDENCTWLGVGDGSNDPMPVNCISRDAAHAVCQTLNGALPSEAQRELAASGRGLHWRFPWGNAEPVCCTAALSRMAAGTPNAQCPGPLFDPVDGVRTCDGPVDVSRDGVLDLAGNVREFTLDQALPFDDACWVYDGIAVDPLCVRTIPGPASARGAASGDPFRLAASPVRMRQLHDGSSKVGFRCAYPDPGQR